MDGEDLNHRIEALAERATALARAGRTVQAVDLLRRALELTRTVPSRSAHKQVEGALRWRLASALLPLGRDDEAESELRLALDVLSHVWDADHERIRVLIALAGLLTQQTRLDEAEEVLRECRETISVPEDHVLHLAYLDAFAQWLNASGRHAEAVACLRRTTAHYRRIEGAEMDLCFALEVLALAESAIGDIDDAVSHAREAVQVRERAGHSSSSVSSARANLANVLMAAGRAQESGEEVEKAEALQADIPEQGTDRARLLLVRSNGEVMAGHFVQALRSIEEALEAAQGRIDTLMSVGGTRSVDSFHKELGQIMWEYCGMNRTEEGLIKAIGLIRELREEYWRNVRVTGINEDFNQALERAGRVADFFELGELMCIDALHRRESCGGHFRAESQTEEGEALRHDDEFLYVAAWEWTGEGNKPILHREPLVYKAIELKQRSYK